MATLEAGDSNSTTTINMESQILKIREMREILEFQVSKSTAGEDQLKPNNRTQGFGKENYSASELRKEIEPWLTALCQTEHLSVLAGAGLMNGVHHRVTGRLPGGFSNRNYSTFDKQIQAEANRSAKAAGRGTPNPEDQLRAALNIADGLRILATGAGDVEPWKGLASAHATLETDITTTIKALVIGVLQAEAGITSGNEKHHAALRLIVSFLMTFASRTGTRDRLHIFTTNYDRLIEFAAELAGLRLIDRFIGTLTPVFRASRLDVDLHYNPPGIRGEPRYLEGVARFTKLHGSLDWVDNDREVRRIALPFGAPDYTTYIPHGVQNLLIYPNDAKDRETSDYPYVELHRDFAAAVCRPNSVLFTYGYSFGDDHINRVIRDMLTIPSTHLVILNFEDTGNRMTRFYQSSNRTSQISLMIGSHFGDLGVLVDSYLPKPAIDKASIRMADLLRARGFSRNGGDGGESLESKGSEVAK